MVRGTTELGRAQRRVGQRSSSGLGDAPDDEARAELDCAPNSGPLAWSRRRAGAVEVGHGAADVGHSDLTACEQGDPGGVRVGSTD